MVSRLGWLGISISGLIMVSPGFVTLAAEVRMDPKTPVEPMVQAGIESFTLTELFAQGAGGCGMSLSQPDSAPGEGFLFVHGFGEDPALIKIDGEWVFLERTAVSGEEFYGQGTSQTFVDESGQIKVETEVSLGEKGNEAIQFPQALLRITRGDQTFEIPVEGDAGC